MIQDGCVVKVTKCLVWVGTSRWLLKQGWKISYKRIQLLGGQHLGSGGARNTARLTWRMIQYGCVVKVTKCHDGVGTETTGRGD